MISPHSEIRRKTAGTRPLGRDLRHRIHGPLEFPAQVGDPILIRPDEELRRDVEGRLALDLGVAQDGAGDSHNVRTGYEMSVQSWPWS